MMTRLSSIVVFLVLFSTAALAQTITGKVISSSDGEGIPGASVLVKGTTTGTATDVDGNFRINAGSSNILVISSLGYRTQEVEIGNRSIINVTLEEDNTQLQEVTVTAMGIERSARSLGYASQSLNADKLMENKQSNLVNALQGKTAGVQIRSTGGAPGQGAKIQIRGINSIDPNRDNSPLFVVDGVIMDNTTSTQGNTASLRGMSNRAVDINPDDIETLNILRGGAATALYGLRGANGVVVITTKSGKAGDLNVTYSGTFGIDEIAKVPKIQKVYTQGWGGVYDPDSFWPAFGPTVEEARAIDPSHPAEITNPFLDGYDKGHQIKNNLSFTGGTEKVTYLTTFSHLTQKGILPFTNFQNIQGRINTNITPSKKFSINTSMSVNNSGGDRGNANRYGEMLTYWAPKYPVRDYKKEDGTMKIPYPSLSDNPIYLASTNKFRDDVLRFIGSTKLNYRPFDWLGFSYTLGVDTYRDNRLNTAPGYQGLVDEILVEDNGGPGADGRGFMNVYENKQRTFNSTFLINLSHQFNQNFSGDLTLGNELYDRNIYRTATEGWDMAIWDWFSFSNMKELSAATYVQDYRLMGNFADLTLNFRDYLYLNMTARGDKTSSLLAPYNSFFYPSVNLSYILTDHLDLPSSVDYAKLRLSYAKVGKDANQYATSMGFGAYGSLPTGYTGFTRSALLGNPTLRPEFTNTWEIGTELTFLDRRVRLDANYYHSVSEDQILSVPISKTTGYATASTNIGSMQNNGVEISLGFTPVKTNKFSWDSDINFSANRNKILSITGGEDDITVYSESGYLSSTVSMRLIPGLPYGTLYGRTYVRYYTPEEIAQGLDKDLEIDPNRPIVIGSNGFPLLQPAANQKRLGNVLPRWIGGWNNTLRYQNLTMNFLFDGQFGQYAYDQLDNFLASFGEAEYTLNRRDHVVFDGVLADGTPNTQQVWLGQGYDPVTNRDYGNGYYRDNYRANSENFVKDVSWLKLRSLSLSYRIPNVTDKFIKDVTLGLTGNNLLIFTKHNGYDPENSTTNSGSNVEGYSGFTYPGVRSYLFNVNVRF